MPVAAADRQFADWQRRARDLQYPRIGVKVVENQATRRCRGPKSPRSPVALRLGLLWRTMGGGSSRKDPRKQWPSGVGGLRAAHHARVRADRDPIEARFFGKLPVARSMISAPGSFGSQPECVEGSISI